MEEVSRDVCADGGDYIIKEPVAHGVLVGVLGCLLCVTDGVLSEVLGVARGAHHFCKGHVSGHPRRVRNRVRSSSISVCWVRIQNSRFPSRLSERLAVVHEVLAYRVELFALVLEGLVRLAVLLLA